MRERGVGRGRRSEHTLRFPGTLRVAAAELADADAEEVEVADADEDMVALVEGRTEIRSCRSWSWS